jgi:hypothetical protein
LAYNKGRQEWLQAIEQRHHTFADCKSEDARRFFICVSKTGFFSQDQAE